MNWLTDCKNISGYFVFLDNFVLIFFEVIKVRRHCIDKIIEIGFMWWYHSTINTINKILQILFFSWDKIVAPAEPYPN